MEITIKEFIKEWDLDEDQERAFINVIRGRNVFITGSAGTGKSHLIKAISAYYQDKRNLAVSSLTGLSATIIGGRTIHSILGVGAFDPDYPIDATVNRAIKNWKSVKSLRKINVLIIDEISMMPPEMLTAMDQILRKVKRINKNFGGIQLIVLGDFFQLPPIYKNKRTTNKYVFQHPLWTTFFPVSIELTHCHRQSDPYFINILNLIRRGLSSHPTVMEFIKERMKKSKNLNLDEIPRLYPTKDTVVQFNRNKLQKINISSLINKGKNQSYFINKIATKD